MELTFPMSVEGVSYTLTVLDFQDEFQSLANDSACGLSVVRRPDDTMVVGAAYDGCYVREEDGEYLMVLLLEVIVNGTVEQYKMEKKCPIQNAMDAPSPDICSAVSQEDKLACAGTPVTRDICDALGCCYSPNDARMPCFFGNMLTTQCAVDNSMVIAVSKDLTRPSLLLDSVSVIGVDPTSCPGLSVARSNSFAAFKFPLSCSNADQVPDGPMNYENTIEAPRTIETWRGSSITRDSIMRVTVRCRYTQTGIAPLAVTVHTLPPPSPVSTSGPLALEMRIARDLGYEAYYAEDEYPLVRVLREPVYLEVRIIRRTDPNLVLVLNDCWATNSADPTLLPQWPILYDSCPFSGDNYVSSLIPVGAPSPAIPLPNYYKRFLVNTFTFVDANTQLALGGLVYFHCSASVCVPSNMDSCVVSCGGRRRRMAEEQELLSLKNTVTSEGPVAFVSVDDEEMLKLEGADPSQYTTLDLARALATAGVIGLVAVTAVGLWLHRRRQTFNMKKTNA
ncbi:PREDICTED: zona pellucida sperm-binding protein 4-like [Nanorana parkeri]|uniref:zona pellucida sperm-binding protein 4-like n=1 Tax=Nanorana parkeri TaxID=125878 RepID=UPI00085428AC|nr:PREDICTED: zona pellucida sperm-binding protein 4-like [Nanorana parkeri]